MKIDPDTLYVPQEVAAFLRCGKSSVYELATKGVLASIRVGANGGGLRIRGADILSFLESRRSGDPAPRMSFKLLGLQAPGTGRA